MHLRIHHIIVFAAALLSFGCRRQEVPSADGAEIRFGVGAVRLEETKSVASLSSRTSFDQNDEIAVYAWHQKEGVQIFTGETVTCPATPTDIWSYAPKKKWRWQDDDYYDFLAVTKKVGGVALTPASVTPVAPTTGSPFSLSVPYDARTDHYDLMMAGTRRRITDEDPSAVVQLDFKHMLSAVRVVFYKDLGSQRFVTTSYGFSDLIVAANILLGWNDTDKKCKVRLDNTEHNHQVLFGEDRRYPSDPADAVWKDDGQFKDYYDPGFYDLLIPQNLDSDDPPCLVVTLRDDVAGAWNEYDPDPIPLKDIKIKGTDTPITEWEAGKVYTYEVHILLNGGVLVNVITTKWEEVEALTPGLMI
jgi:hypothetical protein